MITIKPPAEAIKRCPFCGGMAILNTGKNRDGHEYCYVVCTECGSRSEDVVVNLAYCATEAAISQWNRRIYTEPDKSVGGPPYTIVPCTTKPYTTNSQ